MKSILRLIGRIVLVALLFSTSLSFAQPIADGYEKFVGNIYGGSAPLNFDTYWNQVTSENAGKWGFAEGSRDQFNWTNLDQIYNYAKQRNILFKMHNLVSFTQQPGWINALTPEVQREEVEEWISAVGQKYPNADFVDVVSEPMGLTPAAFPSYYKALGGEGATGWDWVIWTFEKARQYLPNSKLLLNESGVLIGTKSIDDFLLLVNLLKDRNLIDGVGLVGHDLETVDTTVLHTRLDQLASAGLPLYISSLDINIKDDAQQLEKFKELFPLLWNHPAVKGITFWGYIQGQIYHADGWMIKSDGTERTSLAWLKQFLTKIGTYRSYQSGNWNNLNSWEEYNGAEWQHPASSVPTVNNESINIQSGHTITITESDLVDQLTISSEAKLVINEGVNFIIKNGYGSDLSVNGIIENFGTIDQGDSASIRILDGGKYIHKQNGGSLPNAVWATGSTCQIEGVTSKSPSNGNHDFYNVVWNCPDQTGSYNMGWNGNTIGGDITILSTGSGRWQMCAPSANSEALVNIEGDIIQSGGTFTTNGTGNAGTTITINHNGNINVTGGNFSISRGSQGGIGTAIWNLTKGNVSLSNTATQNSNSSGGKFVFKKEGGTQTLTFNNVSFGSGGFPVEVTDGTTLDMGTSVLRGSGCFILNAGAALKTAHVSGIDSSVSNTGTKILSKEGYFIYNGSSAQVTGNLLPDSIANLTIENSSTGNVTLSKDVTIINTLVMKNGSLSLDGNKLIYGTNGTLQYSGTSPQITGDVEFPSVGGPKNLFISNTTSGGVKLHATRTIPGNLELAGKLKLGDNNITASSATSTGLTRYVVTDGAGSLRLPVGNPETLFPLGTATSYAPVWITNQGTSDTIAVRLVNDTSPAAVGGRVNVKWHVDEKVAGGGNYTLKCGWVTLLENSTFRKDRAANGKIFNLSDSTEAGYGDYVTQYDTQPYTIERGGIETLGWFGVGLFGKITNVKEEDQIIPSEYYLSQNYPNPFNPSTEINYQIPVSCSVTLKIYDILGNEVATLVNENQKSGKYTVVFNATMFGQSSLTSGVYFYMLQANSNAITKKMLLLK